ncbi:MAG: hypothetical protein LBQ63_05155 [Deltaproteobacteria bacterium]|jgi:hypothetical protein|nr:hypothetical protein [Deltaproteobacteria bacterium]
MADSSGKKTGFTLVIGARDKFSGAFKGFNDRVDRARASVKRLSEDFRGLSRASGMDKVGSAMKGVFLGARASAKDFQSLLGGAMGLAGKLSLVMGGAAGGLFALAKNTADAGDAAVKSAQRAGVGLEIWQEYAHAANLADLSQEQLIKGFGGLRDAAGKAFQGDKAKAGAFAALGIDPKTMNGEVKSADSLFLELADKVKALREAGQGAKAVNLLGDLLGDRDARAFIPLLSAGREGLLDMRQEAHKLGLVFSEEDGAASEAFNDSLSRGLAAVKGLGYTFGRVLLPPLSALVDKFTAWAAGQREVIGTGFADWVAGLDIDAIWRGMESGLGTLKGFFAGIQNLVGLLGGLKNTAILLGAVIMHKLVFSLVKLAFSVGGVALRLGSVLLPLLPGLLSALGGLAAGFVKVGLAILSTPVGWFIAGIAAIGAAVYAIYKNWDGIVAYFQDLWQGVKDAFSSNWLEGIVKFLWDFNPLRLILKGMNELIAYFTGIDLMEYGARIIDSLGAGISAAWQSLVNWFGGKIKWLMDGWGKIKNFFSFGDEEAPSLPADDSGGWQGSGYGAPLNMGADARAVSESRSEHVERNEVRLKIETPPGTSATMEGDGGTSMQVGWEAYAY